MTKLRVHDFQAVVAVRGEGESLRFDWFDLHGLTATTAAAFLVREARGAAWGVWFYTVEVPEAGKQRIAEAIGAGGSIQVQEPAPALGVLWPDGVGGEWKFVLGRGTAQAAEQIVKALRATGVEEERP